MKYHLQAKFEKKLAGDDGFPSTGTSLKSVEEYESLMKKIDDILSMDESQIILAYGKDPFGLNYLSEYGLRSFIEME